MLLDKTALLESDAVPAVDPIGYSSGSSTHQAKGPTKANLVLFGLKNWSEFSKFRQMLLVVVPPLCFD